MSLERPTLVNATITWETQGGYPVAEKIEKRPIYIAPEDLKPNQVRMAEVTIPEAEF